MVNITVKSPIYSEIPKLEMGEVLELISFRCEYWAEGRFHKEKSVYYKQALVNKSSNPVQIYTGHIPRLVKGLKAKGIEVKVHGDLPRMEPTKAPYLKPRPEIEFEAFKPFQYQMIDTAIRKQRGCFESITATGKTVMQLGLMSAYPTAKILLLCHTKGIIHQTAKHMKAWDFGEPQIIGAGEGTEKPKKRLVVATIQSFSNLAPKDYADYFDMVIIDESHRVNDFDGQYAEVLGVMKAPLRFGFTGTLPTKEKDVLAFEALIGEKIAEVTYQEAQILGITAKPKVKILKLNENETLKPLRNYRDLYSMGVVHNAFRNNKIVDTIEECVNNGESILVFVTEIAQGSNIQSIFWERFNLELPFVKGDTKDRERDSIQENLNMGKVPYCLATTAWREGINIPELDNIFMGSIGKSEIALLQGAGRGNRKTSGKDSFKLWIIFDPSNYHLVNHFGETISILSEKDWL
jgi:superfamily II DNA or RNA helicase